MSASTEYKPCFATAHGGCAVPSVASRFPARTPDSPVDMVHLARQSQGDHDLELEVLQIFRSQSDALVQRLSQSKSGQDRKMAAHTLLGSARGIGAWDVARAAERVEVNCASGLALNALQIAIRDTNLFIDGLLD